MVVEISRRRNFWRGELEVERVMKEMRRGGDSEREGGGRAEGVGGIGNS